MGLRSFFSGLFSRRSTDGKWAKFAADYERVAEHEKVSGKLTDLGLLPATRLSPTEPVVKRGGTYRTGLDLSTHSDRTVIHTHTNAPSPNLVTYLDDTFPEGPVTKAQEPAWVPPPRRDAIQTRFEKFHRENPQVYTKLVDLALRAKASGHKSIGIGLLWERLRWFYTIETTTDNKFRLDNNHRSRYARLIMLNVPALNGFFKTRELY